MIYNWDWAVFWTPSVTGEGTYGLFLLRGLGWTLGISTLSWTAALGGGALLGIARTLRVTWIRWAAAIYIHCFRNTPIIVQLFLLYFVVPELLPQSWGDALKQMNPTLNQFGTVVICMTFYTSASVAEQVRSGIKALPGGQQAAGRAVGLCTWGVYRYVLLPQAFRIVIPALTSDFMNVIKNSAVALTVGMMELTGSSRQVSEFSGQPFEAFIAATLIYMGITYLIVILMHAFEVRTRLPGMLVAARSV